MAVKVLIPSEAQEVLRVGKSTMMNLLHQDGFPSYKVGRRYYINADKLEEWINNR